MRELGTRKHEHSEFPVAAGGGGWQERTPEARGPTETWRARERCAGKCGSNCLNYR